MISSQCQHCLELFRMNTPLCLRTSLLACITCSCSASTRIRRSVQMPEPSFGIRGYSTTGRPCAARGPAHKVHMPLTLFVHHACLHLCRHFAGRPGAAPGPACMQGPYVTHTPHLSCISAICASIACVHQRQQCSKAMMPKYALSADCPHD